MSLNNKNDKDVEQDIEVEEIADDSGEGFWNSLDEVHQVATHKSFTNNNDDISEDIDPESDSDDNLESEVADWAGDELEAAYLRAMEALDASDATLPKEHHSDEAQSSVTASSIEQSHFDLVAADSSLVVTGPKTSSVSNSQQEKVSHTPNAEDIAEAEKVLQQLADKRSSTVQSEQTAAVRPRQIIEACLFVGGSPLPTKKLASVLRNEFPPEFIEKEIDELNATYNSQGRPYEIRLVEGGYCLCLREDFDRIRHKVFGLGPKEVRLTQDALEVLALVAYHQPITAQAIEELGKHGCSGVLRQLLRRELIAVERSAEKSREVSYRTTQRFLNLFGLRSIEELPRQEQVTYK